MTEPPRSTRSRRGGRRPGWVLLTVLLVLAIGASSALVFTSRVELLKLAVILALWAAVVAAFVSVIYRRQSDMDQAKVRDLKLVYDLQLDREISARREYELSVETQLRRELVSELRAQAADEVAGLRAELAALRANLEILFDADLSDRPAIETDRSRFRAYGDWPTPETAGRVTSSRIDTDDRDDNDFRTDESPIIDVPEEPHPPQFEWTPPDLAGGAHRLPSDVEREGRRRMPEEPRPWPQQAAPPPPEDPPKVPEQPAPQGSPDWQPAPAEGQWIPAGAPGSNWAAPAEPIPAESPAESLSPDLPDEVYVPAAPDEADVPAAPTEVDAPAAPDEADAAAAPDAPTEVYAPVPPVGENGYSAEYVGRRRAAEPAMSTPPPEPARGRHSAPADAVDPGRPGSPPTLAAEPPSPPPHPEPEPEPAPEKPRHRSADDPQTGGQSVAELLARLQATPTGGGRRRRRDE
jgi:hypothetical protein